MIRLIRLKTFIEYSLLRQNKEQNDASLSLSMNDVIEMLSLSRRTREREREKVCVCSTDAEASLTRRPLPQIKKRREGNRLLN
jgi:hypothetical protein